MEEVGDCKYDPCEGCPVAKLPENIRGAGVRAVEFTLESQERLVGRLGGQLPKKQITALSRQAVRGLHNVQSSTAAVSAVTMKNEGLCKIIDAEQYVQ